MCVQRFLHGIHYYNAFTVMAEEHPPSSVRQGVPIIQGIAGQARNDGLRLGPVPFGVVSNTPLHTVPW